MGQPSHIGAGACHSRRAGETSKEEGNGEGWNGVCGREQKMPKRADSKGQTGSGEGGSRDSNGAGCRGRKSVRMIYTWPSANGAKMVIPPTQLGSTGERPAWGRNAMPRFAHGRLILLTPPLDLTTLNLQDIFLLWFVSSCFSFSFADPPLSSPSFRCSPNGYLSCSPTALEQSHLF